MAAEAVHAGVPTAILSDFGAHDDYGMHYFFGSGLMRSFADLYFPLDTQPDPAWIAARMPDPQLHARDLVAEAVQRAGSARPALSDHQLSAEMSPQLRQRLAEIHGGPAVVNRRHLGQDSTNTVAARLLEAGQKWLALRR